MNSIRVLVTGNFVDCMREFAAIMSFIGVRSGKRVASKPEDRSDENYNAKRSINILNKSVFLP